MNIFKLIKFQISLLTLLILMKKYQVFQSIVVINIIFLIIDDNDIYANFIENPKILTNYEKKFDYVFFLIKNISMIMIKDFRVGRFISLVSPYLIGPSLLRLTQDDQEG